jgi:integrase/recombinase XerD
VTKRTPDNRCAKIDEWPAVDQSAWAVALQDADPFDPMVGYANRWRDNTRRQVVVGYGRWIGWLERTAQLDPACEPGERVTSQRLDQYLKSLYAAGLAEFTIANHIQQLGNALNAISPGGSWIHILRAAGRLRRSAKPAKDPRARMRPLCELLQLGDDLMAAATADTGRNSVERATDFRDGLLIALLAHRPLRANNLSQIRIGHHLRQAEQGWTVAFSAEEMKASRAYEFSWPDTLLPALDEYLRTNRPILLRNVQADDVDALFVSSRGRPLDANRVGERVFARTRAAFGQAVNAHAFRSIAATTIATETPHNVADAAKVLSHASLRTTRSHYIRAQSLEAGRVFHKSIEALRAKASRSTPRAGPA